MCEFPQPGIVTRQKKNLLPTMRAEKKLLPTMRKGARRAVAMRAFLRALFGREQMYVRVYTFWEAMGTYREIFSKYY